MGWWRRNRWGLLALIPTAAAIAGLSYQSVSDYHASTPHQPVPVGADGIAALDGARFHLTGLAEATDLRTFDGQPFAPPPGVVIWRATIDFDTGPHSPIGGCAISAEDSGGRLFDGDPTELVQDADGALSRGCLPADDADAEMDDNNFPVKGSKYTNTEYFAVPVGDQLVAVRILPSGFSPQYVRLPRR
jgi:hypothetical protein